jgi:hypothetical protein
MCNYNAAIATLRSASRGEAIDVGLARRGSRELNEYLSAKITPPRMDYPASEADIRGIRTLVASMSKTDRQLCKAATALQHLSEHAHLHEPGVIDEVMDFVGIASKEEFSTLADAVRAITPS